MAKQPGKYPCGRCGCTSDGRDIDGGLWKIYGSDPVEPLIVTDRCPGRSITRRSYEFMRLYSHYRRGVLPVAGGLLDQPAVYGSAMTIIEQMMGDG